MIGVYSGDDWSDENISLNADGSAEFAGYVETSEYLWSRND